MDHAKSCKGFEEFVNTMRYEKMGIHPNSNGTYTMMGSNLVQHLGVGSYSRCNIYILYCPCCGKKLE